MSATPGWYPDPEMVGTQRYWDGGQWTEHRAPAGGGHQKPPGFWTLARAVAVGILIAVACVVVFFSLAHSNDDLDCATKNADRAVNGQPSLDCG